MTHDDAYIVNLVVDPDIRYYQGIVDEEVIINTFQLMAWPTSYLIDPDGIVVWEGNVLLEGWKDKNVFNLTEEMLEQFFKDYQKKKNPRNQIPSDHDLSQNNYLNMKKTLLFIFAFLCFIDICPRE